VFTFSPAELNVLQISMLPVAPAVPVAIEFFTVEAQRVVVAHGPVMLAVFVTVPVPSVLTVAVKVSDALSSFPPSETVNPLARVPVQVSGRIAVQVTVARLAVAFDDRTSVSVVEPDAWVSLVTVTL